MEESFNGLSSEEIEARLLSDMYLQELANDNMKANWDSFGLGKKRIDGYVFLNLMSKFSELPSNLNEVISENLTHYGSRIHSHLERLIDEKRTLTENYFGLLFAYYGFLDGNKKYPVVANGEYTNTAFFWSIAPYLARELTYYGVPPEQIINSIFLWGKKSKSTDKPDLPGIKKFQTAQIFHGDFTNTDLILSAKPDNKTHEFAAGIAQLLCQKLDMFQKVIAVGNPLRIRDASKPFNCNF